MIQIATLMLATVTVVNIVLAQQNSEPGVNAYRLGPGDALQVTVFGEADLTKKLRIRSARTR